MSWISLIPAGMSLLGGLMGSEGKTEGQRAPTSQTTVSGGGSNTQHKIDPRMEQLLYGAGGVIPNAAEWYKNNSSGLNDQMITGLNNQWNQLGSSAQGFNQMQNLGMGLMGGGVASNPFTGQGGMAAQNMQYIPASAESPNASPFKMPTPMAAPSFTPAPAGGGGGYEAPTTPTQQAIQAMLPTTNFGGGSANSDMNGFYHDWYGGGGM